MSRFSIPLFALALALGIGAQETAWRAATDADLSNVIPARASVEKEAIETETRTASGITDGKHYVAGVVLITAGYSAEGKYSHYFLTQVPLQIGEMDLKPGEYVFGWRRNGDSLAVIFYQAHTGKPVGTVEARRISRVGRVESFHISAPGDKSTIQIGRFGFSYRVE